MNHVPVHYKTNSSALPQLPVHPLPLYSLWSFSSHTEGFFGNEEHSLLGRNLPAQIPRKAGVAKQLML